MLYPYFICVMPFITPSDQQEDERAGMYYSASQATRIAVFAMRASLKR